MSIITQFTQQLESLADSIPVEIFVFVGALIEEVIAPIPSPIIMTISGSIALAQEQPVVFLFILALIGSVGKTLGSYFLYVVSDKVEDILVGRWGKFFGLTHKQIESIGKHFNGTWKDELVIFLARAIPIMPTAPVSIVCGIIKVNLRSYLIAGFFGTIIRNLFYLYLGYGGLASYEAVLERLDSVESVLTVTLALLLGGGFAVFWYAKNKDALAEKLQEFALSKRNKK